jgi:hypothetical protein
MDREGIHRGWEAKYRSRVQTMTDPILKGLISQEAGKWRASLLVGPEMFSSQAAARAWIVVQAGYHGFEEGKFDLHVETG